MARKVERIKMNKIIIKICACFFMALAILNFYLAATMTFHGISFQESDVKFMNGIVWFLMYQWTIKEEQNKDKK